ncbi:DUF5658 family protein [Gammaproteobacteria bacterium]|nr:DUF5658 family protein [Gammaproteobacteria bacterium]
MYLSNEAMEQHKPSSGDVAIAHYPRGEDRRRRHVKAFFVQFIKPRRQGRRRQTDTHGFHVDFHGPLVLLVALVIMSLCIVDVFATLALLQKGSVELNPIMRKLIETDVRLFFVIKYVATAVGVFLLLSYKGFRLFSKNINSLHTLYGFMALYLILVIYQLSQLYLIAN